MKFQVRHHFECTPERFWKMYWDEELDERLRRESAVQREVLEERREGTVLVRRVRLTPDRELPAAAGALLGAKKLVYEQENRWDSAAGVTQWKVIPTVLPGKVDAKGTFRVVAAEGGCDQIVDGDITVSVMFVGGQIEKAVVAEVEKSYAKMAETCREWLRTHPE